MKPTCTANDSAYVQLLIKIGYTWGPVQLFFKYLKKNLIFTLVETYFDMFLS